MDNNHELLKQLKDKRKSDRKPLLRKNNGNIKNCPYCGKSCSSTHRTMDNVKLFWVLCDDFNCHYEGASFDSEQEAVDKHNEIVIAYDFAKLVRKHFQIGD
jgi:hypothetical protein